MTSRHTALAALLTGLLLVTPVAAQSTSPPDAQSLAPAAEAAVAAAAPQTGQHAHTFEGKLPNGRNAKLNYLLFLPQSYGHEPDKKWPLLVFLHGSREVGRDVNRVKRAILPQMVEENPEFPFIVVSPQAPSQVNGWYPSLKAIEAMLDEVQATHAVDPDRVYLTGLSMGGYGAWALAMDNPDRFAAIAPVVSGYYYNAKQLCELKDKPIWVFGAKRDRNVPVRESERVVKALKDCGGDPKFTVFENANHDQGWELAYTTTEVFEWLLEQRRGVAPAPVAEAPSP
jgi:predicted peptidase